MKKKNKIVLKDEERITIVTDAGEVEIWRNHGRCTYVLLTARENKNTDYEITRLKPGGKYFKLLGMSSPVGAPEPEIPE